MSRARGLLVVALLGGVALFVRDAGACSCLPPEAKLISPDRADDAPSNTKVRLELPSYNGGAAQIVLRVHGGADVEVKTRKIAGRSIDVVDLTPVAPLAPATRYEVATTDAQRHPPTHVIGTFKTAATATTDTTAPRIDKLGAVFAEKTGGQMRSSCSVPGPWIVANDIASSDPGRPNAQLVYGVWLGDAAGNVDASKPPTRILEANGPMLYIGTASSCHFHDFPIPATPSVWLGIAPIDEAGNQGALKKVRVDLAGAKVR